MPLIDYPADNSHSTRSTVQSDRERPFLLLDVALRITFFIVGPVPVMFLALLVAVLVELTTEWIAADASYYQDHRWCKVFAFILAGLMCFAARRINYLESGRWIGPLLIGMGIYILAN